MSQGDLAKVTGTELGPARRGAPGRVEFENPFSRRPQQFAVPTAKERIVAAYWSPRCYQQQRLSASYFAEPSSDADRRAQRAMRFEVAAVVAEWVPAAPPRRSCEKMALDRFS
jgi:hypothetical protein